MVPSVAIAAVEDRIAGTAPATAAMTGEREAESAVVDTLTDAVGRKVYSHVLVHLRIVIFSCSQHIERAFGDNTYGATLTLRSDKSRCHANNTEESEGSFHHLEEFLMYLKVSFAVCEKSAMFVALHDFGRILRNFT